MIPCENISVICFQDDTLFLTGALISQLIVNKNVISIGIHKDLSLDVDNQKQTKF